MKKISYLFESPALPFEVTVSSFSTLMKSESEIGIDATRTELEMI